MKQWTNSLNQLLQSQSLTEKQSYAFFKLLNSAPKVQQAAALALLSSRCLMVEELKGALQYFLDNGLQINYPKDVIDIVGTGGDGINTFNISTAASLVAASAGVKVAKHGGRAASSHSGSVDVVEKLGIPMFQSPDKICNSLDKYGYAYLCGAYFNPLLKSFAPLRKELGFRTLFNVLGPLVNPLRPQSMLMGVYSKKLLHSIASLLRSMGKKNVMLVCSDEGMDELSISGKTEIAHLTATGELQVYTVSPESAGLCTAPLSSVNGGTPENNSNIIEGIMTGRIQGAKRDIVLLNASGALVAAGMAQDLKQGVCLAKEAIVSGKTYSLLNALRREK